MDIPSLVQKLSMEETQRMVIECIKNMNTQQITDLAQEMADLSEPFDEFAALYHEMNMYAWDDED